MTKRELKGFALTGIRIELSIQEMIVLSGLKQQVGGFLSKIKHKLDFDDIAVLCDVSNFIDKLTEDVGSLDDAKKALFSGADDEPSPDLRGNLDEMSKDDGE